MNQVWIITVKYDTGDTQSEVFSNFPSSYISQHATDNTQAIVEKKSINVDEETIYSLVDPRGAYASQNQKCSESR